MDIEAYDKITGREELYHLLDEGRAQREHGETVSLEDAFQAVQAAIVSHVINS